MTDDERNALIWWLKASYSGPAADEAVRQLDEDGRRIKALEAALDAAGKAILAAPHSPLSLVDAPVLPPYGETLAQSLADAYQEAEAKMAGVEKRGFRRVIEDHARRAAAYAEFKAAIALLMTQEPLGPEFEAAINADREGLYEE